jgi:putative ABC transport system permease protein
MNELFGVSMNVIMVIVASLFAVCILIFAATYASNRMMFKMGLRNVRRRRAQSFLVVSGLMLATVIITAAFGTGDTVDYSVTKLAYDNLQRTDLSIHHFRSTSTAPGDADTLREQSYVPEEVTAGLEATFADDADIEGFMPFLFEAVPVLNPRTRLTEPLVFFAGYDQARLDRFGGLELASGERADLAALAEDEVLVGEELADAVEARVGDEIEVYAGGDPVRLRVAGIVRDERSSGQLEFGPVQPPNMAAHLATVQRLVGRVGEINSISVVLRGDVRSSLPRTDAAAERLEALATDEPAKQQVGLGGLTFQVETNKLDTVEEAEMMGTSSSRCSP